MWQSYDLHEIQLTQKGLIRVIFYRKHVFADTMPQFYDMWLARGFTSTTIVDKGGVN